MASSTRLILAAVVAAGLAIAGTAVGGLIGGSPDGPESTQPQSVAAGTNVVPNEQTTTTQKEAPIAFTQDDRVWLEQEIELLVSDLDFTGKILGPSQSGGPSRCEWTAYAAQRPDIPPGHLAAGFGRNFYADRSPRPERYVYDPIDDTTRPEFVPTLWGVKLMVVFATPDWQEVENLYEVTSEIVAISFGSSDPRVEPFDCFIVTTVDVTDRLKRFMEHVELEGG